MKLLYMHTLNRVICMSDLGQLVQTIVNCEVYQSTEEGANGVSIEKDSSSSRLAATRISCRESFPRKRKDNALALLEHFWAPVSKKKKKKRN